MPAALLLHRVTRNSKVSNVGPLPGPRVPIPRRNCSCWSTRRGGSISCNVTRKSGAIYNARTRAWRRLRKSKPAPISRERNSRDADAEERDACLHGGKESEPSLSEIASAISC
jgi:hypothetical protein